MDAKQMRLQVFREYERMFAAAPIRLMSRTAARMKALGYDDVAGAIGDLDYRTVPPGYPQDPTLRQEWEELLEEAFAHASGWLRQLSPHPMGYNLDSVGYPALVDAWTKMWAHQVGITFEGAGGKQVFLFHGGNQALQAALLGVMEARRRRGAKGQATVLVPIPTFSCPLDQMALQGLRVVLLPPTRPDMDPSPEDLNQLPDEIEVDAIYLMPVTNPTGRTIPPELLASFVDAVVKRWGHAAIILDSVYVRIHKDHSKLFQWYRERPELEQRVIFIDSLSKSHGVTGLRAGALLTKSEELAVGALRYAQNVVAGPCNMMQAVSLALLWHYLSSDKDMIAHRTSLQLRIARHMEHRRKLHLARAFKRWGEYLAEDQPVLPDPENFDWVGSLYAVLKLSEKTVKVAKQQNVTPAVAFYLETGIAGVPLYGFCKNKALEDHSLIAGASERLREFQERSKLYLRLSFGMTPPPDA